MLTFDWLRLQCALLRDRFAQKIFTLPWWFRWLKPVPASVSEAHRRFVSYTFFRQIACARALLAAHALVQRCGAFGSHPLWGTWLVLLANIVFLWHWTFVRFGIVACRAPTSTVKPQATRLRLVSLAIATAMTLASFALAAELVLLSWPSLTPYENMAW